MKKFLWYFLGLICILLICFLYFNSTGYRYHYAKKLRDQRIAKLDKVPRQYIYEGVYSFTYSGHSSKYVKDRYDQWIAKTIKYAPKKGEVSFTSKKVTITLNDRVEEFTLDDPIVIGYDREDDKYFKYTFPITNWTVYNGYTLVYQYDSVYNYRFRKILGDRFFNPVLTLSFYSSEKSHSISLDLVENVTDYNLSDYDLNGQFRKNIETKVSALKIDGPPSPDVDTDKERFIFDMLRGPIEMDNLKYAYPSSNGEPPYVRNGHYSDDETSISHYYERIKEGNTISNPFALESTWD